MIVSTDWLSEHLHDKDIVVVDVRNLPNQPEDGHRMYLEGHIPGAVFLDLDQDLADRTDLRKGRHPLPSPKLFVNVLALVGIGTGTRVIAYDNVAGSYAARLWWMMRWIGVKDAAVLDGGITKWLAEGREVERGQRQVTRQVQRLDPLTNNGMVVNKDTVARAGELGMLLIDARAAGRYRGEFEPIDAKAGHIPGALNVPWETNVTESSVPVMRSPEELRMHYAEAGVNDAASAICYCGSGVTACHDILAMEIAGLHGARLYPGSWSEWIAD